MVTLSFDEEEMLETLWMNLVEGKQDSCPLSKLQHGPHQEKFDINEAVELLTKKKLITISNEEKNISLTPEGRYFAEQVIRRHRLSERLFKDILQVRNEEIEGASCKFEHLITHGIEENVCTLLGHPTHCPHGRLIPHGSCCHERRFQVESAVMPLNLIPEGEKVEIAYISTTKPKRLNKLLSFGLLPGTTIILHKKSPALILKLEETSLALEQSISEDIFCRRIGE